MMLIYPRAASVWSTILWLLIIILLILLVLYLVWLFTRKRKKGAAGRAEAAAEAPPAPPAEVAPISLAEPSPEVTAPAPAAAEVPPDDLTRIEGIGPKVAQVLNSIGITTFAALANADYTKVKQALTDAGWPYMDPTTWIEQARLAAEGKWEELAALQEQLKGGRQAA